MMRNYLKYINRRMIEIQIILCNCKKEFEGILCIVMEKPIKYNIR